MIKEKEYKEAIDKLKDIYMDNIYESLDYKNSCMALEESFSKNILTELVKKDMLTLYKRIACICCNEKVLDMRSEEIDLYKKYFAIKMKKDKSMQDIMSLESLAQIIDLKFICKKCGHKHIIDNTENINILKKQDVYKINISNVRKHYI